MDFSSFVGEVMTLKLTSGEELITKLIANHGDHLELAEPLSVAPNHQGMGLIPSMFTAEQDKNVVLNTNSVTMYCVTADQIRMKYIEATTGIATTSKKIIMG